jgi:hypothetical protein
LDRLSPIGGGNRCIAATEESACGGCLALQALSACYATAAAGLEMVRSPAAQREQSAAVSGRDAWIGPAGRDWSSSSPWWTAHVVNGGGAG